MIVRIASRNLVAGAMLLILVACSTGAQGVTSTATPVIPTPATTGISTPLPGSPSAPTAIPTRTALPAPTTVAASSPTAVSGSLTFVRTITNADDGATVQIKVGDRIAVALQAPAGNDPWNVALPDSQILMPVPNPAAAAVQGATLRAFLAVGPGQAAIMATDRIHCDTGQACAGAIRGFRATVVVTP